VHAEPFSMPTDRSTRGPRTGPRRARVRRDQRWTLNRIKTLIGKLFHVGNTVEGTWKLMRRRGWSAQVSVR
jgi:Winged helix-turn helix